MKLILILLALFLSFVQVSTASGPDDKSPKKKKKSAKTVKKKTVHPSISSISGKLNSLEADRDFYPSYDLIATHWMPIITSVRKGEMDRDVAIDSMYSFTNRLWDVMEAQVQSGRLKKYTDSEWVFPVKGYRASAIGGTNGSGYVPGNFDFFDGSTGGHPAHDIFILDKNQDCLDDATGKPVEIVSMSGGIVIETRKNWTPDMTDIKGGNIVYVYDNFSNALFYYAHLNDVYVSVGELVKPGKILGTMGRTGKNAYPKRSPTHLHIMYVRSFDGELVPEDIYSDLIRCGN